MNQLERTKQKVDTLIEYNNSVLIASSIMTGKEYRRKRRKDVRHPIKFSTKGFN